MDMACPWPRTGVGCHDTYSDGVRDTYTGVTIGFAFLVALLLFFASRQLYRVALVRGGLLSLCRRPHTKRTASSPRAVKGFFNTQEMLSVSVFFASLGLVVQVVDPLSWDGVLPRLVFGLCRDWTHAWVFIFSYTIVLSWALALNTTSTFHVYFRRVYHAVVVTTLVGTMVLSGLASTQHERWKFFVAKLAFHATELLLSLIFGVYFGLRIVRVLSTIRRIMERRASITSSASSLGYLAPSPVLHSPHPTAHTLPVHKSLGHELPPVQVTAASAATAATARNVNVGVMESNEEDLATRKLVLQSPSASSRESSDASSVSQHSPSRKLQTLRMSSHDPPRPRVTAWPQEKEVDAQSDVIKPRRAVRAHLRTVSIVVDPAASHPVPLDDNGPGSRSAKSKVSTKSSKDPEELVQRITVLVLILTILTAMGVALQIYGIVTALSDRVTLDSPPQPLPSHSSTLLHLSPSLVDWGACMLTLYFFRRGSLVRKKPRPARGRNAKVVPLRIQSLPPPGKRQGDHKGRDISPASTPTLSAYRLLHQLHRRAESAAANVVQRPPRKAFSHSPDAMRRAEMRRGSRTTDALDLAVQS